MIARKRPEDNKRKITNSPREISGGLLKEDQTMKNKQMDTDGKRNGTQRKREINEPNRGVK